MCVEREFIVVSLRLGMRVAGGKEGRPNKLGVWKCGGLGLDKLL